MRGVATVLACGLCAVTLIGARGEEGGAAPYYADKTRLLVYLDERETEHKVETQADWSIRRGHILANMQAAMGPLPDPSRTVPLDLKVTAEERKPAYTLKTVSFAVEVGDRVPGLLLVPHDLKRPAPAMLCLHQTTKIGKAEPAGLGGLENLHYAAELAEKGYVTLAVDYPNFGDYTFDPYANGYVSATMKGIYNHMRAVDLLQSLPDVDPARIGVIGHSLGGHNSLFVAAFDERIKCVVTSCGFNSFAHYYGGDLTGWSHKGYMPRIRDVYDLKPEKMPFDFTEVLAAIAPRAVFINAPLRDDNFAVKGVESCVAAANPVYRLLSADDRLRAEYPDAEHDFPSSTRMAAYSWLAERL